MNSRKRWVLPVIVLSQFCCTSLWFAGNGVMNDLVKAFGLGAGALGHLTSMVQFGFITGTLIFALLTIADRFSPSRVFLLSAVAGAIFNLGTILEGNSFGSLLVFRFMTGFFLAGIYPVGMKIAADYYKEGLGKSLGYLVGALVVGTAFPHLLKDFTRELPWRLVLIFTSSIALSGGLLMYFLVPDGPYRSRSQRIDLTALLRVFRDRQLRSAAFGYFGHMWELYTFWAFVPVMVSTFVRFHPEVTFNMPLLSFLVIGIGGPSCVIGGYLSLRFGAKKVAMGALFLSGACCLLSPLAFYMGSSLVLSLFLVFWGMAVVADSPMFSTLVAGSALPESRATALTVVNCIGFSITIISIQLINILISSMDPRFVFMVLAAGPLAGLAAMNRYNKDRG